MGWVENNRLIAKGEFTAIEIDGALWDATREYFNDTMSLDTYFRIKHEPERLAEYIISKRIINDTKEI